MTVQSTVLDREKRQIAEHSLDYPRWLLETERVQEVVAVEGRKNVCEYRTWLTHQGLAAYFLILIAKDELRDSQRRCADDLKIFIDSKRCLKQTGKS